MGGDLIGGVIIAIIGIAGSITVAVLASRSNRQNTAVAFSETLLSRLTTVEKKVAELETKLTTSQNALQAAIRFIDRLIEWGRSGGQKKAVPTPPALLHEYLDGDVWEETTIQEN